MDANAFPAASFTPVVRVAVYVVLGERFADSVQVVVLFAELYVIGPPAPPLIVNVVEIIVDALMGSLNVALIG